jgi:hypothetical protein
MTMKQINPTAATSHRPERGLDSAFNSAPGALEISPDLDAKIRKAILREVRRIKFRLYLTKAHLYFALFLLQGRRLILNCRCYFGGHSLYLLGGGHRTISLSGDRRPSRSQKECPTDSRKSQVRDNRLREYPRPKASFTERDSPVLVTEMGTIVNEKVTPSLPVMAGQKARSAVFDVSCHDNPCGRIGFSASQPGPSGRGPLILTFA